MAGLTTHVLDTSIGKPAHNILIELFFLNNEVKNKILECTTNKDGRVTNLYFLMKILSLEITNLCFM